MATTENGTSHADVSRHLLDEQLETFKAGVKKWIDKVSMKPEGGASRIKSYVAKTGQMIKEHPIAAVSVAFGIGYLVVRIARR